MIDNTNLARRRGTGRNAVLVPEMEAFGQPYGLAFRCHEKGHANRKAGEERSFWTNFLPGRTFQSLEDLNQKALAWATVRLDHRPQGQAGLIPAQAFEFEGADLTPLPAHLPAPYQVHERGTDPYGYVAFGGNYYWVPGTRREGSFLKNDHLTAALIDRLTETSHVINRKQCVSLRPTLSSDHELPADPTPG